MRVLTFVRVLSFELCLPWRLIVLGGLYRSALVRCESGLCVLEHMAGGDATPSVRPALHAHGSARLLHDARVFS